MLVCPECAPACLSACVCLSTLCCCPADAVISCCELWRVS